MPISNRDRLRLVFAQSLDLNIEFDCEIVRLYETDGWDSMGHMSLVIAIEEEFDVVFETDQIVRMNSFDTAVTALRELGCAI